MKTKFDDLWNIVTRSELWVAVGAILLAMQQAGVCSASDAPWCKGFIVAIAALTALGYIGSRAYVKASRAEAIGSIAAADPTSTPSQPKP